MGGAHRAENARLGHRYVLDGLLETDVENRFDLAGLLAKGEARKRKASTAMNERSTRAHSILTFRLEQTRSKSGENVIVSRLFLADLGGSERVTRSHANEDVKAPGGFVTNNEEVERTSWAEYYRCRERITETNNINKGLLSLKRCISLLNERQKCHAAGVEGPPVPFRESKLTSVLEPALGGLARTSIVVCCSPDTADAEETVQSLRFGEMCSHIEHRQQNPSDPSSAVAEALRRIDVEVREVEDAIRQKERWEWRKSVRTDVVDASTAATAKLIKDEEMELGGLGAVEIQSVDESTVDRTEVQHEVWGQVLVGAEAERSRLEELLEQRRCLLGDV